MEENQEVKEVKRDDRRDLFTKRFRAGKRTFFFDVHEDSHKAKFVKITESRHRDDGGYDHTRIVVFQEDLIKFQLALKETIRFVVDAI